MYRINRNNTQTKGRNIQIGTNNRKTKRGSKMFKEKEIKMEKILKQFREKYDRKRKVCNEANKIKYEENLEKLADSIKYHNEQMTNYYMKECTEYWDAKDKLEKQMLVLKDLEKFYEGE